VPDDALIDEMKLGVGARANVATRIEDLIARPEKRSLRAGLGDGLAITATPGGNVRPSCRVTGHARHCIL
jgi:hypothetical protein